MKSSLALLAAAAAVSATVTTTEWVIEVVTVTVTADAGDFVTPTSTPTPEPVTTSSVVATPSAPAPPPNSAVVEEPKPTTTITTTTTLAPAPTPTPDPEPVTQTPTPEPLPETTQPVQSAQPTQTSQPQPPETGAPSGSYQDTVVKYHNAYRKDHSAGELAWDATLAGYAKATAEKCHFAHDMTQGGGNYGQNLASYGASNNLGTDAAAAGKAIGEQWYGQEVGNYNFYGQADPPPGADFNSFGHFSQLVWKDSQKVGCYTATCGAGTVLSLQSMFTVCNYGPPGNFKGRYGTNVLPSLGLKISL
ncbi:Allergen V5 Tpx-1-related [Cordyceps militaris]|uniref:Allergen V5 Tpx-1-related n=1 Tax=Cordyceps militaris TaxID=73501 RepID=A0A2H4SL91_CORMI|nr:Allergen V5 Tpx-1-related [Cordyceps militaris]